MTINEQEVAHIAQLAQLELSPEQSQQAKDDFGHILSFINQLDSVDTTGVEPLVNPLMAQQVALRLRDDIPSPRLDQQQRATLMANAPAQQDGLFLVPTVIE